MANDDLGELITVLGKDVSDQYTSLLSIDTQLLRRSFLRSFFSYVEGLTYILKQKVITQVEHDNRNNYTVSELAMLNEEQYNLSNRGEALTQRKFLPTGDNFLFAMRMYLKGEPVTLDLDVGGSEWQAFLKALEIRHRIVHPKSSKDFDLSDEEKELVMQVSEWFNRIVISKLLALLDSYRERISARVALRSDDEA